MRRTAIWAQPGDRFCRSPTSWPTTCSPARGHRFEGVPADVTRRASILLGIRLRHPLDGGLRLRRAAARRRSRHRRHRHGLRPHRARPRPRRLRRLDWQRAQLEARGIDTEIPDTVDEDGAYHRRTCRCSPARVMDRQGQEGRRQRRGDQGADRGRHAARARPAQAPLSAFLALQGAGDLPQHAAMVHRMDEPLRARTARRAGDPARARAGRHRRHPLRPAAGRQPHPRHGREPARLADHPPARLGLAAGDVRRRSRTPASRCDDPASTSASSTAFEREGADAWYPAGARELSSADHDPSDYEKVEDILDVWFDSGSTHAFVLEDPEHLPGLAGITARRWPARHLCISKAPTSIAAGSIPRCWRAAAPAAARPTTRPDPRLHPRRERAEDVEVARQRGRAAGRHQADRRRDPALWVCALGLRRGPAHRPGNPADHQSTPTASCATRMR